MDWARERGKAAPPTATERANPAANPGPRGNQDIDEYDYSRSRERFLAVLGS